MPQYIKNPTVIEAAGNKPKLIEEFVGGVNSQSEEISIARMKSPAGWVEPVQTPDFDEYTLVLKGTLQIKCAGKESEIAVDQIRTISKQRLKKNN